MYEVIIDNDTVTLFTKNGERLFEIPIYHVRSLSNTLAPIIVKCDNELLNNKDVTILTKHSFPIEIDVD